MIITPRRSLLRSIAVSALALGFCGAVAANASAACPTPRQLKISGARWSERQAAGPHVVLAASESERDPSIVGLWRVDIIMDGQVIDQAFDAWHGDGTETLNDAVSPLLGNVCLGVWEQTGRRTYRLKHPSWSYDDKGMLNGTVVISELVTVDRGGNTYHGTVKYDVFDLDDHQIFEGNGEVSAVRITPR